jgi:hypothetical protein
MEGIKSSYCEYLVKKKADGKTVLLRALLILAFAAFVAVSFVGVTAVDVLKAFVMIMPMVWVFVGFLVWILWGKTCIEFEYTVVSGFFQLDIIYSKKRRKRICEIKLSDIKTCAPVSEKNAHERENKELRVIDASVSPNSEGRYFMIYTDSKAGDTLVYFNADKRALDSLCYYNRKAIDRGEL